MFLKLRNDRLIQNSPVTYLSQYITVGEVFLPVMSSNNFSGNNKFLLIGEFGDENAEIVSFTSSYDDNNLSCGALKFDHAQDSSVYLLSADCVAYFYTTDVQGAFYTNPSSLPIEKIIDIAPDELFTTYEDTTNAVGYGRAMFYNSSTSGLYGTAYEIIKYNDEDRKTRGFVKELSMERMNATIDDTITERFLDLVVIECDERLRDEKISWSEETSQLVVVPEIGITSYDVSSYVKDDKTINGIQGVYIQGNVINSVMKNVYTERVGGARKANLLFPITEAAGEAILSNSNDFTDSGVISIMGVTYTYTSNDRILNKLSGITGLTGTIDTVTPLGGIVEVWQGQEIGVPDTMTILGGKMLVYPVPSSVYEAKNITVDYTKTFSSITSDSDELAFPAFLYIDFLKSAIAEKRGDKDAERKEQRYDRDVLKHISGDFSAVDNRFRPGQSVYPRRK